MLRQIRDFTPISAVSMGASINGDWIPCQGFGEASFHFVWSAGSTPVGSTSIQVSNEDGAPANGDAISGTGSVSGDTGTGVHYCPGLAYKWIRPVYTRTSGGGTLSVYAKLKE